MTSRKWSESWRDVANNAATVAVACDAVQEEQRIKELTRIVELKSGCVPNVRQDLGKNLLIGYVEEGEEEFDPRTFQPKRFARLLRTWLVNDS